MTGILNIIAGSGQVKNITPDVEYLVVAGGGGTASGAAGGGGAGGVRTATGYAITPNSAITVTVGAAGSTFSNGSNSVFGTIISTGGGSGGPQEYGAPGNGGSGGGAGINSYIGGSGTGGSGIAGQGYAGGNTTYISSYSDPNVICGAGGGGASAVGGSYPYTYGAVGRNGVVSSITGITYGRSEEHTSNSSHSQQSRMPSSA